MTDQTDYRMLLDERFAHLTTLINANHKEAMDSNDRIEKHVIQTNGRVNCLEEESKKRQKAVDDFREHEGNHKKRDEWIKKNLIWLIPAFILLIAGIIIAVELVGAKVVFERAIDKLSQTIK